MGVKASEMTSSLFKGDQLFSISDAFCAPSSPLICGSSPIAQIFADVDAISTQFSN